MRKLTVTILLVISCAISYAQRSAISGSVADSSEKKSLANAVVSIVRKSDSVLVSHVRTGADGAFRIPSVPPGQYLVLVTYPKYADFLDEIAVAGSPYSMGRVSLIKRSELLQEVIVSQKIGAIRIKGDTLEFRADSFKVREGATAEELLKKLPGMQVNKKGEITSQGEKVQKVLVDGEEFFSDDPAVVTQNLRADAVEKVQVFDKKSDQATFTGIDDGEKTKTINLTLKEDKKRGSFGKVKVAGGLPRYFENEGMFSAFKGRRKIAAFGTMSNTGKAGLNWQDADKFGGGNDMQYNEDEGYYYSFGGGDEFNTWGGRYNGEGLPTAWNGGAHYSNKWNADKNNLNFSYRFYKLNLDVDGSTISQYILPDTQYFKNENRRSFNQNMNQKLNGFYDFKIDSFASLKVTVSGSRTDAKASSRYGQELLSEDGRRVNSSDRILSSDGVKQSFNTSVLFRRKFRKVGRTISANFDQNWNENNTDGLLRSDNRFYDEFGAVEKRDSVDQQKINQSDMLGLNGKIAYTEPLSKKVFLEINAGYRMTSSEALRNSFNKSSNGKYEVRDPIYSNDYKFNVNTTSGGTMLRVNGKKAVYSFGGNIGYSDFRQKDLNRDTVYNYSYLNLFPRANFRYMFSPQKRLNFGYNGNTRQPTLEQIQPIRENSDPLNIQIGNSGLKQEFRHNFSLSYSDYKVLTSRNIYGSINFSATQNAISNSTVVDSVGRRFSQFVNVSGNYNVNIWSGYWLSLKKWDISIGVNPNANISKYNNLVNGVKNVNDNKNLGMSVNVNKNKENKYEIYIRPGISYNWSKSSIRPDVVTKYWSSQSEGGTTVYLPKKFELSSEVEVNLRQKTPVFSTNVNSIKWNAYLAKKFWKNNSGEVRASVYDILNQNIGLERNVNSNFISENRYNTVRRYWLLSFTYNFNHNAATAQK